MKTVIVIIVSALVVAGGAFGQSVGTSASYELLHAPPGDNGSGGQVTGSGGIVAEISTGDAVPGVVSNVTGSGFQNKGNLVGQLYDVTTLAVSASPATVDETGTRQLAAAADLDDATTLDLAETDVAWSVVSGPVSGIDVNGLATGGIVYEDTAATVRGTYLGIDGDLGLTVLDVDADNYLSYGGDGIDDDWQVDFFGAPPNVLAGPGQDPDKDEQDNLLEFFAGFSPLDPAEFFVVSPLGFSAASTYDLQLNKAIPGRTYTVFASGDLVSFTGIGSFSVVAEETDKLVQDPGATAGKTLYRVEISRP